MKQFFSKVGDFFTGLPSKVGKFFTDMFPKNAAGKTTFRAPKVKMSLVQRQAWAGRCFALPFYFGFWFFYLYPIVQSIIFAFSYTTIEIGEVVTKPAGWANFNTIFNVNPNFTTRLTTTITELLWEVPVIIVASLFIALILKSKFHGRTLVRGVFFLPVVLAGGIVMSIVQSDTVSSQIMSGSMVSSGSMVDSNSLQDLLVNMGLGSEITEFINKIYGGLFGLLWRSGVQMIIFLSGLQSIPTSLYEASAIEGATAWEDFWKITIPMIGPIIMLNIFFTIIETFTDSSNAVMAMIVADFAALNYGTASAMAWVFFLAAAAILGIVAFAFRKVNVKS